MGIDGGSTSTKAVLVNHEGEVMVKCYQLSKGNPLEDTMEMFANLRKQVESQGATVELLGVGSTGYAKDILKDVLNADVALVETVAHTQAALHFYPNADVICDVGGQDIKLIILQDGRVKDFKLNTQCSAGNGYFLQSTCVGFGHDVMNYADLAFSAKAMPMFGYGCAVFMQSDIVDFQRQGWKPEEIMAGLANVLPKNIWLYVSQIPNLASLGNTFILQGGTQHNLAAVKSQVDFIESRFKDKGAKAQRHRARALRGSGRHRRRHRSAPPVQQRPPHQLCRLRGRREDHLRHPPQREHALLLLQEQVHADLHRRADRQLR